MSNKHLLKGTKVHKINLLRNTGLCPRCGTVCKRTHKHTRQLHEVGISVPTVLEITVGRYLCLVCCKYFTLSLDHLTWSRGKFTLRVRRTAVDLVVKQSFTLDMAAERMRKKYHVHIPSSTLHEWVKKEMD